MKYAYIKTYVSDNDEWITIGVTYLRQSWIYNDDDRYNVILTKEGIEHFISDGYVGLSDLDYHESNPYYYWDFKEGDGHYRISLMTTKEREEEIKKLSIQLDNLLKH